LAERLPEHAARLVFTDAPQFDGEPVGHTASASGAACVHFVTTPSGQLLGVVNTHGAVCDSFHWAAEAGLVAAGDRVLQSRPLPHEAATWEVLWTLLAGATLVMPEPRESFDGTRLRRLVEAERVTVAHCTPAQLAALAEGDGAAAYGSLRRVICSGGALADDLRERLAKVSRAELHHLYGAAGAAVPTTSGLYAGESANGFAHVGRPVANARGYILDRFMEPPPVGVVGELYVGGEGLARGYLNRPELTAERFVPDPFSPEPGARLYRTGDQGRRLPDGNIELIGRAGRVVEVGGVRVALERIEAALLSHGSVREAAAALHQAAEGGAQLVGYVVGRGTAPTEGELRGHLTERIPYYATPTAFVVLDALPLTGAGEVNRAALPAPLSARTGLSFVAAQTPLEEMVAGVWREVLGVERVGVHDNFFDLGGRSLLITQAHSRLEQLLGRQLALVELFKYPTVSALAEYLGGGGAAAGESLVAQGDERGETRRTSMRRRRNARQAM
jgi:acyl-CoA synthetase (AMP-forming)/AMP-acid ligase II